MSKLAFKLHLTTSMWKALPVILTSYIQWKMFVSWNSLNYWHSGNLINPT